MTKRHLILMNALLWSFAAYKILGKGLPCLWEDRRWWIILICLVIAAGFIMMFNRVSGKYTRRIHELEGERFPFYMFMSPKGYVLIAFMMTLGISMSHIPGMPDAFFAAFYPALGSGLVFGAIKYLINFAACLRKKE